MEPVAQRAVSESSVSFSFFFFSAHEKTSHNKRSVFSFLSLLFREHLFFFFSLFFILFLGKREWAHKGQVALFFHFHA